MATGDGIIAVRSSSQWTSIIPSSSTAGYALTSNGAATLPSYQATVTGAKISTGPSASEPSTPSDGDVYFPNNDIVVERYSNTSGSWIPWGPIHPLVAPPASSNWTWDNQGSATFTNNGRTQTIYKPATGGGLAVSALYLAVPSSSTFPYTLTAGFIHNILPKQWHTQFLGWRSSSGGYAVISIVGTQNSATTTSAEVFALRASRYFSATSFDGDYSPTGWPFAPGGVLWFRLTDDGATRTTYYSTDGLNFIPFQGVGSSNFIKPASLAWGVSSENAAGPNMDVMTTLISWKTS